MTFEQLFSTFNLAAMGGWICVLTLPRCPALISGLRFGLIGGLALAYAILILVYFFRIDGGGFGSMAAVRNLMLSDGGLLAGWIHYLAFDLFVGIWIAERADEIGMNRLLQAIILVTTFMFGPIGLLLFMVSRSTQALKTFTTGE
jgi:hypothetical protein